MSEENKNPYLDNNTYIVLNHTSHEDWKRSRSRGIGGSDVACIVGQNPYKQAYQLWQEKKGLVEPKDISNVKYVWYGTEAEEYLRKLFQLDFGDRYEVFYVPDCILQNKEHPFMRYSPDAILYDKKTGEWGIWECKTTNIVQSSQKEKWEHNTVPMNYYCQVLHGLNVTEFSFVVLKAQLKYENPNGFCTLTTKHYYWHRNDEQVSEDLKYLKEETVNWWNEYMLGDKEPPVQMFI